MIVHEIKQNGITIKYISDFGYDTDISDIKIEQIHINCKYQDDVTLTKTDLIDLLNIMK